MNGPLPDDDAGPFGGRKFSAIGCQPGAERLDTFGHTKLAMIDYGCLPQGIRWFPYQNAESFPNGGGGES